MIKVIKAFLLTMLAYLLQVTLMQHLKIYGVTGNLLAVNIAVLTVSLGKKYAFGASCLTGILLEAMTSSVGGLYVVIYPVFSMLFAQFLADMSDERREKLLLRMSDTNKKFRGDLDPHLRIPIDAMSDDKAGLCHRLLLCSLRRARTDCLHNSFSIVCHIILRLHSSLLLP